jgi:hypothetical protein
MPNTRRKTLNANTKLPSGGPTAVAIARLLVDQSLSYAEVARRVREGMPGTQTSSRSVASVASRLRREGYRVPDRRFAQPLTN